MARVLGLSVRAQNLLVKIFRGEDMHRLPANIEKFDFNDYTTSEELRRVLELRSRECGDFVESMLLKMRNCGRATLKEITTAAGLREPDRPPCPTCGRPW